MFTLTVDIGNSKVKFNSWDNESIIWHETIEDLTDDTLIKEIKRWRIDAVIVSSTRGDSAEIVERINGFGLCDVVVDFNQKEIKKYYSGRLNYEGSIGPDRVAAYLGSRYVGPNPKLIIDMGTAITTDIVDKDGIFQGGNISLGYSLRYKALAHFTKMLPEVKNEYSPGSFGHNTQQAIQKGVNAGVEGELLYSFERAKEEYGVNFVLFTGGNALLGERTFFKVTPTFIDENLVGRGLNYHLRKHYFPEEFRQTNFVPRI